MSCRRHQVRRHLQRRRLGGHARGDPFTFVVAYFAVAWLLRFIAHHTYTVFIVYRVVLGTLLLVLLATGTVAAT